MSFFPAHYRYGWIACYFNTHYVLGPIPVSSLMVHHSSFGGAKNFDDTRRCICESAIADFGCTMLNKNKYEILNDDGTLSYEKLSYLIVLRSGFPPFHHAITFYLAPYSLVCLNFMLVLRPHPIMIPYTFGQPFYLRAAYPWQC